MKVLLVESHSCGGTVSEKIAKISARNHWEYTCKRGYDLLVIRETPEMALNSERTRIAKLLQNYDAVLLIGVDVLFTNFAIGVENILIPGDNMVMAKETEGWPSLFNAGTVISCNTPKTIKLFETVEEHRAEWLGLRLIDQEWLNIHYEDPVIKDAIRLVPTRTMNSTYKNGKEGWQPGDWLCHFYGHQHVEKPALMLEFMQKNMRGVMV